MADQVGATVVIPIAEAVSAIGRSAVLGDESKAGAPYLDLFGPSRDFEKGLRQSAQYRNNSCGRRWLNCGDRGTSAARGPCTGRVSGGTQGLAASNR